MKNITSEMIEEAVNKPYEDISENFFDDFWNNYKYCEEIIKESLQDADDIQKQYLASDFAAYKTARDHCIEIFRNVLKELLCEEKVQ